MMSLHTLSQRFSRHRDSLLERGRMNVGDIVLHWDAAPAPTDPNVEASYADPQPQSETLRAFIYFVSARSTERQFAEIRAGDAIVSFHPSAELADTARPGLYFVLPDGLTYVQASAGKEVVQFWDVFVGGETLTRTLLLRLKQ